MAGLMAGELVISLYGMVGKRWKLNIHNISMVEMVGWWFPSLFMDKIHRIFMNFYRFAGTGGSETAESLLLIDASPVKLEFSRFCRFSTQACISWNF